MHAAGRTWVFLLGSVCACFADAPAVDDGDTDTPATTEGSESNSSDPASTGSTSGTAEGDTSASTGSGNCTQSCVWYVDVDAAGDNDGTSWSNAFNGLQDALAGASSGDEIWVAAGTYPPAPPGGNRSSSFRLVDDVSVYGGFAGNEVLLDERDPATQITIVTGDLNGDDAPGENRDDNAFHVVVAADGALLDGFVISGGHADVGSIGGGGIVASAVSDFVLRDCIVADNYAAGRGGGMAIASSTLAIVGTVFKSNEANDSGGGLSIDDGSVVWVTAGSRFDENASSMRGGGLFAEPLASVTVEDALFLRNVARLQGGGVSGSGTYRRVVFRSNTSLTEGGGAVYATANSTMRLENVVAELNEASLRGSAFRCWQAESLELVNVTASRNSTDEYAVLFNLNDTCGVVSVINTIFWGNLAEQPGAVIHGAATVRYSNIEEGHLGDGNIDVDPGFVSVSDFSLTAGSLCIDAADGPNAPAEDLDGNPRVDDPDTPNTGIGPPWADIGALEYQF